MLTNDVSGLRAIFCSRDQSGQSRAGKIARVANQNTGFASSLLHI